MNKHTSQSKCLCGSTIFSFKLKNSEVHACHCSICRKQTSGINLTIDIEQGSLRIIADKYLTIYDSSEWAERGFCNRCGTNLFWRLKDDSYCNINVFSIEHQPQDLKLTTEVYIDHKPDFYDFKYSREQLTEADVIALFSKDE